MNVVVWNTTGEKYRRAMLGSTLLTVYGHVERVTTGVTPIVHLIAVTAGGPLATAGCACHTEPGFSLAPSGALRLDRVPMPVLPGIAAHNVRASRPTPETSSNALLAT